MPRSRPSRLPKDPAEGDPGKAKTAREKAIDRAVEMTFPASDAAAPGHATSTEPPMRPANRQAPVISKDDIEAAAKGTGHARGGLAAPRASRVPLLRRLGKDRARNAAGPERSLTRPEKPRDLGRRLTKALHDKSRL
jgi:hypothetical protein